METIFVSEKEAIQKIRELPYDFLFVMTFDFENGNGISDSGKHIDKLKGEKMIREAKTRIFSEDEYIPQINLYDVFQFNIKKIKPMGIRRTIFLTK